MISNSAPAKMILQNSVVGYTKIYVQHSIYSDYDVYERAFWITEGSTTIRKDFTDISKFSVVLSDLLSETTYAIEGAYVDAIIDSQLLDAKFGINVSDSMELTTLTPPKIVNAYCEAQPVDVGVGAPIVYVQTTGQGDFCAIEIKPVDSNEWERIYQGPLLPTIQFGGVPIGTYNIRIAGFVAFPDASTIDSSPIYIYPSTVEVKYNFIPPSAPENMQFKVAHVLDGKERYDLRIEWDWTKGSGANVREFVLEYVDAERYAIDGFARAQKVNGGAAKAATIFSFPFKVPHKFRASAVAWGPDTQAITSSVVFDFIIDEDTPIDNSFTNETGIDVNYAHIKGKLLDTVSGNWLQTFLVDAATGSVSIGLLDEEGKAPISFDPINRRVNVDGRIITKIINAASFVLTNLDGEDNPALYTQGKAYGDTNAGIWMGMDNSTAKPKVDIGNATQYIRFDGDRLSISSEVVIGTPTGDISLGKGIQGKLTVFVYKLATALPAKPLEQDYPPPGWSLTPPNRTAQNQNVYAVTGLLDPVTNKLVSGTSWSDVVQWTGTQGINGTTGPGFYAQGVAGLTTFIPTTATSFFTSQYGRGPVVYDVITQFNAADPRIAFTRMWNGVEWGVPAVVVHGDMIVNNTIRASKLVADYGFFAQIGVNVIYDRAAALSNNPEAYYIMKIDLASGYIHIR